MKKRILVVDDDPLIIAAVEQLLVEYEIIPAASGEEGIVLALAETPSLILLDILLPGIDGIETCKKLKENKRTVDIPIIFLTVKTTEEDIITGLKAGAVDYIKKPFSKEELQARVGSHLEYQRIYKEKLQLQQEYIDYQNRIIGIVAHDLRSPAVINISYLEILNETLKGNEDYEKLLDKVLSNSQYIYNRLNQMLQIEMIKSSKVKLCIRKASVHDLLDTIVEEYRILAERKNINIYFNVKESVDAHTDPVRLRQIIDNVLDNAIKFSPENTEIFVCLTLKNDSFEITIEDQGRGIPEEHLTLLFKEYNSFSQNKEGRQSMGLGLAIAGRLAGLLKGNISIESSPEKGTLFVIEMPVKYKAEADDDLDPFCQYDI